jgi:hypothetical protein
MVDRSSAAMLKALKDELYVVVAPGETYPQNVANKPPGATNTTTGNQIMCKQCSSVMSERFAVSHISQDGSEGVAMCLSMPKKYIESLAEFPDIYRSSPFHLAEAHSHRRRAAC